MQREIKDIPHITRFLSITGFMLVSAMMIVYLSKSGYRTYGIFYNNPNEGYAKIALLILVAIMLFFAVRTWKIDKPKITDS